jgi:hypothetical protein
MAFGRRKQNEEADEPQPTADAGAGTDGAERPAGEEATAVSAPGAEPASAGREPGEGASGPLSGLGGDLSEATAPAGDASAAGVDAGDPGHPGPGDTATHAVPGGPGASQTTTDRDPETVGSVAGSHEPAAVPVGAAPDPTRETGDARGDEGSGGASDEGAGPGERAAAAASGAQGLVESRPEVLVAGAFVGGLVAARVLGALGGNR